MAQGVLPFKYETKKSTFLILSVNYWIINPISRPLPWYGVWNSSIRNSGVLINGEWASYPG